MLPKPAAFSGTPLAAVYAAELPFVEFAVPGSRKFAWLKTLKNSARNCNLTRSRIGKLFEKFISKLSDPGPRIMPLATLPNVPIAGSAKALGLM